MSDRWRRPMRPCSSRRMVGRSASSPRSPDCAPCISASPRRSKHAASCCSPSTSTRCRPRRSSISFAPRRIPACSAPMPCATASTSRAARCACSFSTGSPGRVPIFCTGARKPVFGGVEYADRIARLRLRQAYGRLVRRADDRGVFVMLDRAVPSRLLAAFPEGVAVDARAAGASDRSDRPVSRHRRCLTRPELILV